MLDKEQDIYLVCKAINGIEFTPRQVDVLACLLANRGTKKIASLLDIYPRTVESHIKDIRSKLQCSSREEIIDFIERSEHLSQLKNHYTTLLIHAKFYDVLRKFTRFAQSQKITCYLHDNRFNDEGKSIIEIILKDLRKAGITTKSAYQLLQENSECRKNTADTVYNIYFISHTLSEQNLRDCVEAWKSSPDTTILALVGAPSNLQRFSAVDHIHFKSLGDYYLAFLKLLSRLHVTKDLAEEFSHFEQQISRIRSQQDFSTPQEPSSGYSTAKIQDSESKTLWLQKEFSRHPKLLVLCLIASAVLATMTFWSPGINTQKFLTKQNSSAPLLDSIRVDLPIPHNQLLLTRASLLKKIDSKLNREKGIQTVVLVGAGGAGKTTTARQYARQQKASVIWEINAESHESLLSSFKELAYASASTREQRAELRNIRKISDIHKTEQDILIFVKQRLKERRDWLLIFNDVESFSDIQNYFPYDSKVWGNGKIIMTSRDLNIENNPYIAANEIINVGELSFNEKFELFAKTLNDCNNNISNLLSDREFNEFLKSIPPFPLDISIAASHAKISGSCCQSYSSQNINPKLEKYFLSDQSGYKKNRYEIVVTSLEKVMTYNPEFTSLLLLIGLLSSHNIPKHLLCHFKNTETVDEFIYILRKYALVVERTSEHHPENLSILLHKNVQEIITSYLIEYLSHEDMKSLLNEFITTFEMILKQVIENDEFSKMPLLAVHGKSLLEKTLISEPNKAKLGVKVSILYRRGLGHYALAKTILEDSLKVLKQYPDKFPIELAYALGQLGNIYIKFGQYHDAQIALESSLKLFRKHSHVNTGYTILDLANTKRRLGEYSMALALLKEAVDNFKIQNNQLGVARAKGSLGLLYIDIGEYSKAQQLLLESSQYFSEHYGEDHVEFIWLALQLGVVYREAKDMSRSNELIEKAKHFYKRNYGDRNPYYAYSLIQLGTNHSWTSNYKIAESLLQEGLKRYRDYYGEDHVETAWAILQLGKSYLKSGKLQAAEKCFLKAQGVFETKNHFRKQETLEALATLQFKKMKWPKEEAG